MWATLFDSEQRAAECSGRRVIMDRRVRRTRDAITDALVHAMLQKGYEAVTVQDIIDLADVGRSTFYAHFTDKQDVLRASLEQLRPMLAPPQSAPGDTRLFAFSIGLLTHVHAQRRLHRAVMGRRGGPLVQQALERMLREVVHEELSALVPPRRKPAVPVQVVERFVVGAFLALLMDWLDGELTGTPAEIDAAFRALAEPGVRAALS